MEERRHADAADVCSWWGTLPVVWSIAGYGFVLNAVWEFAQAGPLYDMWTEVGLWDGFFHITLAILGDVLIVLGVTGVAALCMGRRSVLCATWNGCAAMLAAGLVTAIGLEWIARMLDWWTYNDLMPTLRVFGETVGLSPVAQITLLPALSVLLAARLHALPQ
ncbi:MAG: hypothetical protein ABEL51_11950 [Salinibacter sp.]